MFCPDPETTGYELPALHRYAAIAGYIRRRSVTGGWLIGEIGYPVAYRRRVLAKSVGDSDHLPPSNTRQVIFGGTGF